MNGEFKKLMSRFIFIKGIILCAVLIALGSVTAVERTEYNMYRKHYTVVNARADGKNLEVKLDGKQAVNVDFSFLSDYVRYTEYLSFSYGGNVYYLVKTAKELFF